MNLAFFTMMDLAVITWNVRPELVEIGGWAVRWYGLLFALGFYLGFLFVRKIFRAEGKNEDSLNDLLVFIIVGAVVGARLGHCLFYEPEFYLRHPLAILKIWQGGLASHGGAAGVFAALCIYSRRHPDQPLIWLVDRIVVPTALAACLIRLGNLMNSEILGRPTDVPWAFVFLRIDAVPRHPVQLYESLIYLVTFGVLVWLYLRFRAQAPRGLLFGTFLTCVFSARFLLEFFKERQASYEARFPLSVGQLLSLPFIAFGLVLLINALRTKAAVTPAQEQKRAASRPR